MAKLKTLSTTLKTVDTRTIKPKPKTAEAFYLAPEWRALMKEIIAERGRVCEECGRRGTRIFGDHIVELKDGGASLDRRNVMCRCGSCHTKKTLAARAARLSERY